MSNHWNTHKPAQRLTRDDVNLIREINTEYEALRDELREIRKYQNELRQRKKLLAPKVLAEKFEVHESTIYKVINNQSFFGAD